VVFVLRNDKTWFTPDQRKRCSLSARHKLNQAYVTGCVLLAGVAGYLSGSWLVFGIALAVLLAANLYSGDIRPDQRR
jgi:hypothetical protein